MSDADTLRRAADLLARALHLASPTPPLDPALRDADAALIGLMSPAVAVAIVDWLRHRAAAMTSKVSNGGGRAAVWAHDRDALIVARLVLGEADDE